ncbi:MAG: hypothetical protein V1875_05790 [Candidatus Altiarchaeota archaeon]
MAPPITIKIRKKSIFVGMYLGFILALLWAYWPESFGVGGGGWWVCLDYVGQGTLYGGQPYCAQGPVIYYAGFVFDRLIGWVNPDMPLIAIGLLSNLAVFITLRKILLREGIYHPTLYPLLYVPMVYRFMGDVPSMLSAAFFALGFWWFYGRDGKIRAWSAACAFCLAIVTKYMAALPIIITVAYVCFIRDSLSIAEKNGRRIIVYKPNGPAFDAALNIGVTFFVVFLLLNMVFPNLREYTLAGHSDQLSWNMKAAIEYQLDKRSLNNVAAAIMFAILAALALKGFFDRRTIVFPLAQITLPLIGALFIQVKNVLDTKIGSHYMLCAYVLLLVSYLVIWKKSKKAFALLVLVTLVYPSIFGSPLLDASRRSFEERREDAMRSIQYGLHFIPPQDGYVLTEGDYGYERIFESFDAPIDPGRIVVLNQDGHRKVSYADATWTPTLKKSFNFTTAADGLSGNYSEEDRLLREEMIAGKYSLIMFGPPSWEILLENVDSIKGSLDNKVCLLFVPNFQYENNGRSYTTLIFTKPADCGAMKEKITKYYSDNADMFCSLGYDAFKVVRMSMQWNGITLPYTCNSKIKYVYGPDEKFKTQWWDFAIMAALYLPTYYLLLAVGRLRQHGPAS